MDLSRGMADAVRKRAQDFERFAAWEATQPIDRTPGATLEAVGALRELLPASARRRPVDPAGVMAFHRTLSRLFG